MPLDGLRTPAGTYTITHIQKDLIPNTPVGPGVLAANAAVRVALEGAALQTVPPAFRIMASLLSDDGNEQLIHLHVVVTDGVPRCDEISAQDGPGSVRGIDAAILRAIPIAKLLQAGAQWFATEPGEPGSAKALEEMARAWNSTKRPKSFPPTPENLKAVAVVVKRHVKQVAKVRGRPSYNDVVAKTFYVSRPTAARRIKQAKDAGLLTAADITTKGKTP